jgi:hypothetical protein
MPFNDDSLTDLERTRSAIGGLKAIMDSLSFTGGGIPGHMHDALAELERQELWLDNKAILAEQRRRREQNDEPDGVQAILDLLHSEPWH